MGRATRTLVLALLRRGGQSDRTGRCTGQLALSADTLQLDQQWRGKKHGRPAGHRLACQLGLRREKVELSVSHARSLVQLPQHGQSRFHSSTAQPGRWHGDSTSLRWCLQETGRRNRGRKRGSSSTRVLSAAAVGTCCQRLWKRRTPNQSCWRPVFSTALRPCVSDFAAALDAANPEPVLLATLGETPRVFMAMGMVHVLGSQAGIVHQSRKACLAHLNSSL